MEVFRKIPKLTADMIAQREGFGIGDGQGKCRCAAGWLAYPFERHVLLDSACDPATFVPFDMLEIAASLMTQKSTVLVPLGSMAIWNDNNDPGRVASDLNCIFAKMGLSDDTDP